MRVVALGHWNYFTWHLPATVLSLAFALVALGALRSLWGHAWGPAARALRYRIAGWASLGASVTAAIAWPYLRAPANVRVDAQGRWHLSNYLGVPLGRIEPGTVRELRGVDLGGLGVGAGPLEIRLENGVVFRTVRVSGFGLDEVRDVLGYTAPFVRDERGDRVIAPHRYTPHGPELVVAPSAPLFVAR